LFAGATNALNRFFRSLGLQTMMDVLLPQQAGEGAVVSRAAGASARGAPALELNFTFNQSLALASLTDPESRAALSQSAGDAFERFQRVIEANILPRLDRLEGRVA
jgi:hypothetical protein